jgi:hypothetical protein
MLGSDVIRRTLDSIPPLSFTATGAAALSNVVASAIFLLHPKRDKPVHMIRIKLAYS